MSGKEYTSIHHWLSNIDSHAPPEYQPPFDKHGSPIYRIAQKPPTRPQLNTEFAKRELAATQAVSGKSPNSLRKRYGTVKLLQKSPTKVFERAQSVARAARPKLSNAFTWEAKHTATKTPQIPPSPPPTPPKHVAPIPRKPVPVRARNTHPKPTSPLIPPTTHRALHLAPIEKIDPTGHSTQSSIPPIQRTRTLSRSNAVRKHSNPFANSSGHESDTKTRDGGSLGRRNAVHRPASPFSGMSEREVEALLARRRGSKGSNLAEGCCGEVKGCDKDGKGSEGEVLGKGSEVSEGSYESASGSGKTYRSSKFTELL